MIRDICKDETFLAQKAEPATPDDVQVAADLLKSGVTSAAIHGNKSQTARQQADRKSVV